MLGVFAFLAFMGLAISGWWFSAERKYQADLELLRNHGYATSPEELQPTSEAENALDVYRAGSEGYKRARTPPTVGPIDELDHAGTLDWSITSDPDFSSRFRERFGQVVLANREAAALPAIWNPELKAESTAVVARLQAGLVFAEVRDSNFDEALDAFELLCKISSDYLSAPFVQQYANGEAGARFEFDALGALLPAIQNDRPRLERLNKILDALQPVPTFDKGMRGEFAHVLDLTADHKKLEKYMSTEVAKRVKRDSSLTTGIGMRLFTRKAASEIASLVSEAPTDDWRAFDEHWSEVSSKYDSKMNDSELDFILHQEIRLRTGVSYAKALTYRRLNSLAAKVLLDRVQGKYPPDIASFGDLAQDPFGADVFRHVFGPSSMLIYSLDYNGKDDGGAGPQPTRGTVSARPALDIVVHIPLSSQ